MTIRTFLIFALLLTSGFAQEKKDSKKEEDSKKETEAVSPEIKALKSELSKLQLKRDILIAKNAIKKEQLAEELTNTKGETEKLKIELELLNKKAEVALARSKDRMDGDLVEMREAEERLKVSNALTKARAEAKTNEYKLMETEWKSRLSKLTGEITIKEKTMERRNYAERSPMYLMEPFDGTTLTISDRRIELNGPISMKTATHISTRINYFNNMDAELPIFIVIDDSPGGSVMAGYKILKAMEGSQAPVYTVVKSFAASMAAGITTLAERSFAYPNAIILHHQISFLAYGNLSDNVASVEDAKEWWRRLAQPVAKKMGIGTDEFIKIMYEKAPNGDWQEFADEAKKLKWVDNVVEEIHETSLVKNPDFKKSTPFRLPVKPKSEGAEFDPSAELTDAKGKRYILLPRINPADFYYLYNPDNYYRVQ